MQRMPEADLEALSHALAALLASWYRRHAVEEKVAPTAQAEATKGVRDDTALFPRPTG